MRIKKRVIVTFVLLLIIYLFYSHFILSPQKLTHFSLIDDGQTYQNSVYFNQCFFEQKCKDLGGVLVESQFGRFRPAYWFVQYLKVQAFGANPLTHHLFRVYGEGTILVVLLFFAARQMQLNFWGILVSFLVFVGSFSFSENILRLGPVEPNQIVLVSIFSMLYLSKKKETRKKYLLTIVIFALAILSKETSIILIGPLLLIELFYFYKNKKQKPVFSVALLIIGTAITAFGRIMAKPTSGDIFYSNNFNFNFERIVSDTFLYFNIYLNEVSPLFKFSILVFVFMFLRERKKMVNKKLLYWVLLTIASFAILLPWKFVLERYLLLTVFASSLVIGYVYSQASDTIINYWRVLKKNNFYSVFSNLVLLLIITNIFFRSFPVNLARTINFSNWYSTYLQFESDQVEEIASLRNSSVYINGKNNLNNWEVLYEIPIHLKYFYTTNVVVEVLQDTIPNKGYIFTRQPFDLAIEQESLKNSNIIASRNYQVKQIDPLKFEEEFQIRPLSVFKNLPYDKNVFKYYWEVRKI